MAAAAAAAGRGSKTAGDHAGRGRRRPSLDVAGHGMGVPRRASPRIFLVAQGGGPAAAAEGERARDGD